jgi:hypothetical protein
MSKHVSFSPADHLAIRDLVEAEAHRADRLEAKRRMAPS